MKKLVIIILILFAALCFYVISKDSKPIPSAVATSTAQTATTTDIYPCNNPKCKG